MKFKIETLGCKVNTYESEYLRKMLEEEGYTYSDSNPSLVVINTCTVTNLSDVKSRQIIRREKRKHPDAIIAALGCYIQNSYPKIMNEVDINIGNGNKKELINALKEFKKTKEKINLVKEEVSKTFEPMSLDNYSDRCRAFVKVQDGCNNFCSYCIIPYVRGRSRSKPKEDILNEIYNLINNNYREIVLTGINLSKYGIDLGTSFNSLLKDIIKLPNLKRLRISSLELDHLDDEFLSIIKNSNIIVNHFHLPIQSGSDKILKSMNRHYDRKFLINELKKLKEIRPDAFLAADIIVGFPGETEEDFMETYNLLDGLSFAKIHVFPYSKREGTRSSKLKDVVDGNIIKERARRLNRLSNHLSKLYYDRFIGKTLEVLIENNKDGFSYGHTENFIPVKINEAINSNTFVMVKLLENKEEFVLGEIVSSE